jgi:CelD/BcsL family acetyltransferase involved in cellulose biosynthesis
MKIQTVNPVDDPLWRRLVEGCDSSLFHAPDWLGVLAATYGFDLGAVVAVDDAGAPRAGLPFCRVDDLLGGRIVCLPFSDYCDPLVAEPALWEPLLAPLLATGLSLSVRCLRSAPPPQLADRLTPGRRAMWHGLDLRGGEEAIWAHVDPTGQRAIHRAERDGVRVRAAECERELRAFYELHLRVRKYKYRLLAQPYRLFQEIWRRFVEPGRGALLLAVSGDEIIGGDLFLEWRGRLYYKWNASAAAGLAHRPNDLLIWEGIRQAIGRGCSELDFGLSDCDQPGLVQFKRKFASAEGEIVVYSAQGAAPADERALAARRLLGQLTALLTDDEASDALTARAGDLLYRYFA